MRSVLLPLVTTHRVALVAGCLGLALAPAAGTEPTDLEVSKGAPPEGGVVLDWGRGAPPFEVYRSDSPVSVAGTTSNRLGETNDTTWTDGPPDGQIFFYLVQETGTCVFAGADAGTDSARPDDALGGQPDVAVELETGRERHTLLRFHLDEIPPDARVERATLRMDLLEGAPDRHQTRVVRLDEPWNESLVTWNTRPVVGPEIASSSHDRGAGWRAWDVTDQVRRWVDGTDPNHGMSVQPVSSMSSLYASKERDATLAPRLCVDWTSAQQQDYDRLKEASSKRPTYFSESTDRAEFIDADVDPQSGYKDVVVQALRYLYDFRDLYRLHDPQSQLYLEHVRADPDSNGTTYDLLFRQRSRNIELWGSFLSVHVRDGRVVATSGNYLPDVKAPAEPEILAGEARANAEGYVPGNSDGLRNEPRLVYYDEGLFTREAADTRLAWLIALEGTAGETETPTEWDVLVDALDGTELLTLEMGEDLCNETSAPDLEVWDADGRYTRSCGFFLGPDRKWFTENGARPAYPGPSGDAYLDGQEAFDLSLNVYDYYYDEFCFRSWNGNNVQIEVIVHDGRTPANASFRGSVGCRLLTFSDSYVSPDILGHEFHHGVDHATARLTYMDESGAIDESMADVFGSMIDFRYDDGDWLIGEDIDPSEINNEPFCASQTDATLRDMSNPPDCGDPDHRNNLNRLPPGTPKRVKKDNDNGFVHSNSGLPNKVAYLLSDGGVHNQITVGGFGRTKLGRLYFTTHTSRLSSSSGFWALRNQMIDVAETFRDQRLHGFTTTDVCDVINAWASTGYGNPDSDCDGTGDGVNDDGDGDGIRDGTDNCVLVPNIAQDDTDGDGDGDACDPDDDGDGVDDRDDNCPKDPNGLQQDDDNDGEGDACENDNDRDGVDDPDDNCVFTANGECSFLVDRLCDIDGDGTTTDDEARKGYQRDTDGDGNGDACDGDLDGDDIPNSSDACPFTASSNNSDGDEDGVGDPCDNCPESPNPDQADLDQDGTGDVCDPDPDGDELIGENDNCPETYNPDQADNDKNGVGLWCDGGELAYLNGIKREGDLALLFEFRDPREPVVFPLFPCEEDCPDWIPAPYRMRVEMRTEPALNMRVVDTDGRVIAHSRVPEDGVHDLTFRVRPEYSYTSPATGGEVPYQDDQALQRMQAVGYRLELYLPPESSAGVSGDLLVTTIPE